MKIISADKVSGPQYKDTVRLSYQSSLDGAADWAMLENGKNGAWLIVLHGHGSNGDQLFTRPDISENWLPLIREKGLGIIAPNLRNNAWMNKAAIHDLHELIGFIENEYQAVAFFLASGSMGGTGNLIYAVNHPEDIGAVVALCPATDVARYYKFCAANKAKLPVLDEIGRAIRIAYGGTPDERPEQYRSNSAQLNAAKLSMPVYVCHAADDQTIPVSESRALSASGAVKNLEYQEIAGHHDSPLAYFKTGLEHMLRAT